LFKLKYKEYLKFLNRLYFYTWFGTVYAFHKLLHGLLNVNCPKSNILSKGTNIRQTDTFSHMNMYVYDLNTCENKISQR
jgi:hypothetical protein